MLPGPTGTATELLETPGTGVQVTGDRRLEVLSKVNPVDVAGQEMVTLAPLTTMLSSGGVGGVMGARVETGAEGMPLASGPPSAATSSSVIRPSRIWTALTHMSWRSLSSSAKKLIFGTFKANSESILPRVPPNVRGILAYERPFEFRPVRLPDYFNPEKLEPTKHVWFRAVDRVPANQALHRCLLAYVSDYHLLDAAMLPHGVSWLRDNVRLASIDHAMWFHRDVKVDDWLLYAIDSPSASGARGLARGSIFARDGTLVASTGQEGLIRVLPPSA